MGRLLPTVSTLLLLACCVTATAQPADVTRVLRTFDFEERQFGNVEDLPMRWVKVEGPGLPHYVNGKLATDAARSGRYSFRFELNGGGLIYRYDPNQIKVTTGAHYRIEGHVRTAGLQHARARITAYFVDQDLRLLPESIRHSELYAGNVAGEDWKKLSIEISADSPKAAFLVLELGLLQPAQYAPATLGQRTLKVQDVKGLAWFDDITISQVPRVQLSTARPGNVFRKSDVTRLQVRVDDRFTEDLVARLIVRDAEGKLVYQRNGAIDMAAAEVLGPGSKRSYLDLPELPAGWYQASMGMISQGQILGVQSLAFIRLADDAPPVRPDGRFGHIATNIPPDGWDDLPALLPLLVGGRVKIALWSAEADQDTAAQAGAFDNLLQKLQAQGITPTACLLDLPPGLAQKLKAKSGGGVEWSSNGVKSSDIANNSTTPPLNTSTTSSLPLLLRADSEDWQPRLAYLVARHANHLDRWQIGDDASDAFVTDPRMRQAYKLIYREFGKLVQSPDLAMPWPAWYELDGDLPATVALSVPAQIVLPQQLPLYVQDVDGLRGQAGAPAPARGATTRPTTAQSAPARPQNLSLTLNPLDRNRYSRQTYLRDFALRVLYALSADAKRIDMPLPMSIRRTESGIVKEPEELLLVMRTLLATLSGATFKGKVPVAEGVEAFLFDRYGQGILAVWDRGGQEGIRELNLNLGVRPVQIDLWGNATPLLPKSTDGNPTAPGEIRMSLGAMPVLLVDIDGQLAQTRASVAIDRPMIESSFQSHVRKLTFTNHYSRPITGTFRLRGPAGWVVSPQGGQFSLNPGESFDRSIGLEIPYNATAGNKTIDAQFIVEADRKSTFTVPLTVQLGLTDIGMQTIALRDGPDVVIQQMITNYGDKPVDYTAFASFPGQARQERLVPGLKSGQTTIKRYRFTNVPEKEGQKARVGMKEGAGVRILNDEVEVR